MKRGVCLFLSLLCAPALGELPTVGYVYDYYQKWCANPDLEIPGQGVQSLTAQQYLLQMIDLFNEGASTYSVDTPTDNIVSVGYLVDSLGMLEQSNKCCVGGYHDAAKNECWSCGDWRIDTTDLCSAPGQYFDNGSCVSCGAGYICSAGVSYRTPCGAGYWCPNSTTRNRCDHDRGQCPTAFLTSQPDIVACNYIPVFAKSPGDDCWADGLYFDGTKCQSCPDGYVCPAGGASKNACGAGFWCAGGVRTECEHGIGQCPSTLLTEQPVDVACDYVPVFRNGPADECVGAGVYYNGSSCATCPDGYACPSGSTNKIECGAGFWCVGGVRTRCEHGRGQCPSSTTDHAPTADDLTACDDALIFIGVGVDNMYVTTTDTAPQD